jgi:hypothetical protein
MLDEEGDCEVVSGSIGEDGCQIDVASFYAYPCYGEDKVLFEVGFTKFPEMKTWDMCFVINADNDPTTGFQDPPMEGNEYYYCWGNEQEMIFYNRFSGAGDFLNEIPVADPQMYVVSYPDSANVDSHFGMTYPPPDTVDPEYADSPYVVFAEAHYYDPTTGVWVRDIAGPAFLEGCPPQ